MCDAASPIKPWPKGIEQVISSMGDSSLTSPETVLVSFADALSSLPTELNYQLSEVDQEIGEFDQKKFAHFMKIGAFESAALLMIGSNFGIMLSRSGTQDAIASVWIVPMIEEASFESHDVSLALIGAYGKALIALSRGASQIS